MTRSLRLFLGQALCGCLLVFMVTPLLAADLTKKQIKILETEFLPAWKVGNTMGVLESLNKAIRTMDDQQLGELDELLSQQDIPSSSQLLLESRLMLLRQGMSRKLPRPGQQELVLTLEHVNNEVSMLIDDSQVLNDSLERLTENATFDEFDSLLWDTHVMTQKLESSLKLAEYAVDLLKNQKRIKRDKLDERQQELIDRDFTVTVDELKTIHQNLHEHEIVARIKRLTHAKNTLATDEGDRKEKFLAAWSVSQDSWEIKEALKAAGKNPQFQNPLLQDEQLPKKVDQLAARGMEMAGDDLITKSRLLFEGLHWWFRGRYGMGTDAYGLLKSPNAVNNQLAYFALMMPEKIPTPTNPKNTSRYQIPEIDRRHHYIWAWEYRTISSYDNTTKSTQVTGRTINQETRLSRFY